MRESHVHRRVDRVLRAPLRVRFIALLCAAIGLAAPGSALAAKVPAGFTDALVASGLVWPTALVVADDGRIFVTEQGGAVKVIKNGALLPTPFVKITVRGQGGAANEEGLVGITLDPSFPSNGFVYVYYTVPTSGNVGSHNRVSRFTASGDVATPASEKILLEVPAPSSGSHNAGALHFGADGNLYIAVGDHTVSANGQSMTTLKGKLLRINSDGTIPHDNPFFATATGQNRAIWALGLRNPYRFAVQRGTGRILINDVGNGLYEEINEGVAGANYGWNVTEGPTTDPRFRSPLFAYSHQGSSTATTGCAIVGGAFYNPILPRFPAAYVGQYFFADYCGGWLRVLDPNTRTVSIFATGLVQPVDLQVGNDGALYYLDRQAGSVRRITFASTSSGPLVTNSPSSVTVARSQSATFTVSAEGSQPMTFQWQRDEVDIPGETSATFTLPSAELTDSGASFRVVVTNAIGTMTSDAATLTVIDNGIPSGTIALSAEGYRAGDTIFYEGAGTDPEDGALPPTALTWRIDFHHDTHFHPFVPDRTGASGSFTIPAVGETSGNVWYRVHLTVKDSLGTSSSSFVDVLPHTVRLDLETNPPGLQVRLDGPPAATPAIVDGVIGIQRTIGVVSPQTVNGQTYVFSSWAHGGPATQTILTPAEDTTYIANFALAGGGTFSDTFDRPSSPELGEDWLEVVEGLSIAGNELRSAATKNVFQMAIVPALNSATQNVAASFARVDGNSGARFGLVLRYQDPQNYYLASRRTGGTSAVQISKIVQGRETVLASKTLPNPTLNAFSRLEAEAKVATLTLKVDGVLKLSVVDSTFSVGNVGVGMGSTSGSIAQSHRADNFVASGSDGALPPTLTLTATPTRVEPDQNATLAWSATGATTCAFTSGPSGERPSVGSEATGPLAATASFGMTCTGPGGSVSKSVSVAVGSGSVAGQLPSASEVHSGQAMDLPASVRAFVFLVPNESHHEDTARLISKTNGYLLPMKVTLPAGATVSVVNADNGHEHNLAAQAGTAQIFSTGKLLYGDLSAPVTLTPGSYVLTDGRYPWIRGEIGVTEAASEGSLLVGAFFVPENRLAMYRTLFPDNGFRIESEHKFSYGGKVQYLFIFSTDEDIATAAPKLRLLVRSNSYG